MSRKKSDSTLEKYCGSFYGSIQPPPNTDVDKIPAKFSNGALHVSIPKSEKHTKKIDIK